MSVVDPSSYDFVDVSRGKKLAASQPVNRAIRLAARALAAKDGLKNQEIAEASEAFPVWKAGERYQKGDVVTDPANGRQYIVVQAVEALEVYPPHSEGVLAIYRPVPVMRADGSCSYIYGQNVFAGDRCYDGGGKLWVAQKDMLPCTWPPAAGNEWKEAVADET